MGGLTWEMRTEDIVGAIVPLWNSPVSGECAFAGGAMTLREAWK